MKTQPQSTAPRARHTASISLSPLSLAIACALGGNGMPALANPAGDQVVSGAVIIRHAPGVTTINQTSSHGIVNWQSFSIQAGELTRFIQPSANSATLNRVLGGNLSAIHGSLQANGQVFLINPNGVLIGPGGSVQTGAFVASTRDVSNAQFMQGGPLDFLGSATTSVVNLGSIHASSGDVHLIAYQVNNKGSITAPNGTVGLASGTQVLLSQGGNERLLVKPQGMADGASVNGSVTNTGRIAAANVELKAAGGNPFALAINAGGSISAVGLESSGGRILLKATQGKVVVTGDLTTTQGSKGGEIQITGSNVRLASTAVLQASGSAGGGTVLVGGDYQGKNPDVQNAQNTFVEAGAKISADATVQGDGGKVIVWADETTNFFGTISARGGADGGNGGFAEVSGKQALAYRGTTDLRAPKGRVGTLLLDPTDITITNSAATGSLAVAGNTSTLTDADIQTALNLGNLDISTTSAGGGGGDITFAQLSSAGSPTLRHTFNTANRLRLFADRDIIVNDRVYVDNGANAGQLFMQAGRNLTVNNHGFGSAFNFVYLWSGSTTLIADANNSGNGTGRMSFAPGVNLFSNSLRLFVPSTDQLDRPASVTVTNSTPIIGKWVGDSGTTGAGIYARRAATPAAAPPAATPSPIAPITIPITPKLTSELGLVITPFAPSLDELVAATGDEKLINALKVLKAAQEQLATNPNNKTAQEVAAAAEKAIRERLPDFDRFQQNRLADAAKLNDQEINLALNNIAALEAYIVKFGKDKNTTDAINTLKAKIDARMTALEGMQMVADYLDLISIPEKGKAEFKKEMDNFLLQNAKGTVSDAQKDALNKNMRLIAEYLVIVIETNAKKASNASNVNSLLERNKALSAQIAEFEANVNPGGTKNLSNNMLLINDEEFKRKAINQLYDEIDKNNTAMSKLVEQAEQFDATAARHTKVLEGFSKLRNNINTGRYTDGSAGIFQSGSSGTPIPKIN
jgi:filamentous hemagglutinin family protein